MNIELKPIAESKIRQLGGDVCGVLVRKDEKAAAVDEHGRVTWLPDGERAEPVDQWLIQMRGEYLTTRGVWERPDHRGYTNDINEAGRYSEEEAKEAERMMPEKCKAVRLPAARAQSGQGVEAVDALHPSVLQFAKHMQIKLDANKHKDGKGWDRNPDGSRNGWAGCSEFFLRGKLREEVAELEEALTSADKNQIRLEAADVGNIAMMLADNFGGLSYTHPQTAQQDPDIQLIQERDHWEEKATELAEDVGKLLGVEVGEHSSGNCPVQTAIDAVFMASEKPAQQGVPEGWSIDVKLDGVKLETPDGPAFIPHKMNKMGDLLISLCRAIATTPQPEGDGWIKCSERLPTESDADENGEVWWFDGDTRPEFAICSMHWSFGTPSETGVTLMGDATHWKPTGLKRPQPPQEGE